MRTGGETKRFDSELAMGQVSLPLTDTTCRVDIEVTEMRDAKAQEPV